MQDPNHAVAILSIGSYNLTDNFVNRVSKKYNTVSKYYIDHTELRIFVRL